MVSDTGSRCHVAELPVPLVAIQMIAGPGCVGLIQWKSSSRREVEVVIPIQVVVEGADPAPVGCGKRPPGRVAALMPKLDPRGFSHQREVNRRVACSLRCGCEVRRGRARQRHDRRAGSRVAPDPILRPHHPAGAQRENANQHCGQHGTTHEDLGRPRTDGSEEVRAKGADLVFAHKPQVQERTAGVWTRRARHW